jgi:hypothetical protein
MLAGNVADHAGAAVITYLGFFRLRDPALIDSGPVPELAGDLERIDNGCFPPSSLESSIMGASVHEVYPAVSSTAAALVHG